MQFVLINQLQFACNLSNTVCDKVVIVQFHKTPKSISSEQNSHFEVCAFVLKKQICESVSSVESGLFFVGLP